MATESLCLGAECSFVFDLPEKLDELYGDKISMVAVPLFHPRFRRDDNEVSCKRVGPGTRSDLVLSSRDWTTRIIGKISPWIHLDSLSQSVRLASEKALVQEVEWAGHLSIPAVLLGTPSIDCVHYANVVNQLALKTQYMQFWVRVPLYYPSTVSTAEDEDIVSERTSIDPANSTVAAEQLSRRLDSWEAWNLLRSMCEYNDNIGVALEITADLPPADVLNRWLGEPIKAVIIPINIFLTNRKGYPTLSRRHQQFFMQLFQFKVQYLFKGRPRHQGRLLPYAQYMQYLFSKKPPQTPQDLFEMPYLDYLQSPLQPLMDNLESQTYETFERDPIKYSQYEKAITDALLDLSPTQDTVVTVVGAGRGPLVKAALRAAELAQRTIKLYAVEKNPNAVITLRNLKISESWDNVTIVASDMREWDAPEKTDIMVSELLGSFGDNELSPECLDGAQKHLAETGISIPSRYVSYLAPISTSKLWNKVKSFDTLKAFETPYVVRLHNIYSIADAQPCFEFAHPNLAKRIDNRRYSRLQFTSKHGVTVHGFAGYFEAHLYGQHMISINPDTFSDGMFSWFPLYFPLRTPMYVPENHSIHAHFWRKCSSSKVWYEWTAAVQDQSFSAIHNPNGRSYWIGL